MGSGSDKDQAMDQAMDLDQAMDHTTGIWISDGIRIWIRITAHQHRLTGFIPASPTPAYIGKPSAITSQPHQSY